MTVHLEIRGKVQGVFFRATAKKIAEQNDLNGWIENNSSGGVKAVVTGRREDVEKFIEWCRSGPEQAAVDEVIISHIEETIFKGFNVKR